MKKTGMVFLVLLLAAAFLFFTAACLSSPKTVHQEENAEPGKTRLRFISSWGGVDSKAGALREIFNRFMEDNPDIEVVNESLFGEDFLPKIKTDFASGNNPDVFGLWPGSDIRALIKAGKVAELTDVLDEDREWKSTFGETMWAYTTFDGKTYGLPVEIIFECLFVNKDLFKKYGVRVPGNYEELKEAVRVFKDNGILPFAYNSLAEGTYLYQNMIAMLGGKEAVEHPCKDGKLEQCYIDAMDYVRELYRLGAFSSNTFTITNNERNILFKEKKAAMIVQGSWFIGDFKEDTGTVDIIPFPHMNGNGAPPTSLIYGLGCGTFHMSRTAWDSGKKREASLKLLKTLTSRETASYLAEQTGMLSNVDIGSYHVNYNRLTEKGKQLIENSRELIGPPDSFVYRSTWENVIAKQFPYMLEGKKEPAALWDEAVKEGILSEYQP